MAPTYTTTAHGLRWLPGSNLASDIDAGFQALAEDVDTKLLTGGKTVIATTESRTNTAYGKLPTPDQVSSVVVPTDGVLVIRYQALWSCTSSGNARAAIFIGANQLKVGENDVAPETQAAAGFGTNYRNLHTAPFGLISADVSAVDTTDVTTGQVLGSLASIWSVEIAGSVRGGGTGALGGTSTAGANVPFGGPCEVFVAAGTYDISVQFKSSAGTISVKNRKLWVRLLSF